MPTFTAELTDGTPISFEAERQPTEKELEDYLAQQSLPPQTSAAGTFAREAIAGAPVALGGAAAWAAAAALAPETGAASFLVPLGASLVGAIATQKAEQKILQATVPEFEKARAAGQEQHPVAAVAGGLASSLPTFEAAPGEAIRNLAAIPAALRGVKAAAPFARKAAAQIGIGAGVGIVSPLLQGDPPTFRGVGESIAQTILFGDPRSKLLKPKTALPLASAAAAAAKAAPQPNAPVAGEAPISLAERIKELKLEGVSETDAQALLGGKKTIKEVVEGAFSKFIRPAWNADVEQSRGGHGEAWVAGYNDATARLKYIIEHGKIDENFVPPSALLPPMEKGEAPIPLTPKKPPQEKMNPVDRHKFEEWARGKTVSELRQLRDDHENDPTKHHDEIVESINKVIKEKSTSLTASVVTKEPLKEITPEHIGFDEPFTEPPWRLITDEEAASPTVLGEIATTDARIKGSDVPVSTTRRVLVMQDKESGTVHAVSVYRSGRTGAMALDPALAGKPKAHRQLATLLDRYKPLYSVLLKEPVKDFHQKFDSLQDFYGRFGDKAIELAGGNVGVAPTETTEPVAPEEAPSTLPTSAELGQVFKVIKSLPGQVTPEMIARAAGSNQRQIVSALKKITQHLLETQPNLEPDEALARAIDTLHEHAKSTDTPEAFTKSVVQSLAKTHGERVEPEYEDIGHTGETELESRHGTPTGLPAGVKDGGPNYAAELMEASRRLGTLVKSKTNLPQNVEGRYRRAKISQDDSIEVGDIRNQGTVAHEMGHDIDALLFPAVNLGNSQASLAGRVGGQAKALYGELLKVTELMRGAITGSRGHQQYRKRATELVADFFSLYAHDPDKARAMAPTFTQGFEAVLQGNRDAAETIRQLHAGNVEPVAPQAGQPPTATPAQMPGAVPARPKATPIQRDAALAVAAEDLVAGQVRRFESEVQAARIKSESWREDVPNPQDRNDVGAFVEGIGNLEIPGDTIGAVENRMSASMKQLAKTYRFNIELQRQRVNDYLKGSSQGEYLKFLEDYLPHFYANSKTPAGRNAAARFIKESPNAKQRKIPTLREAVEYGLVPITQDPATLYETTARINWRVATNRKLLSELKGMQSAGQPIVVPAGKAPPGWPVSNNPLIQRVYAHPTASGMMLWRGGAAIHPDAWRAVRMMLETPTSSDLGRAYDAVNSITRANAFAFALFHDVTLRSASLGAQMEWYNPIRGLFRLFERNPLTGELEGFRSTRGIGKELLKDEQTVSDAALHGLKFAWTDSASYQKNARDFLEKAAARWRDVPYLGEGLRLARDVQHWRHEGLWRNTHDAFKIAAYEDLVSKALQESKPTPAGPAGTTITSSLSPKEVKQRVASLLNDAFGGQEWETKFWLSPQMRQTMARFFLAPDWTLSTLRSVPFVSDAASVTRGQAPRIAGREPLPTRIEGVGGNLSRARFWGAELAALAGATLAAQYAIYQAFGKKEKGDHAWTWENEVGQDRRVDATPLMRQMPWHKPDDPTRYYINLGKRPEEILGWFTHLDQQVMSKMSRPVAEIFKQVTGTEDDFKAQWKRDHEAFVESLPARAVSVGKELIPFSLSGNQFALSLPYRKGMTKYKAEQAYESAYELAAEPSKLRSLLRGQSQNTDALVSQITDAAQANGVEPELVRRRALSTVRGKYYDQYFKALQKQDEPAMEKAANALLNLGAGATEIERSISQKQKMVSL